MFLSKVVLDLRSPKVRRDVASPYEMHRTILSAAFHGVAKEEIGRTLFRIDEDRSDREPPLLLIQSDREPRWDRLPDRYCVRPAECKQYDPQFCQGQQLRFRLRANPTKRVASGNEKLGLSLAGKRVGLFTESEQVRWFLEKSTSGGFRVPGRWEKEGDREIPNFRMDAIPEGRIHNGKPCAGGWFLAVRFEGILEVTDPAAFRAAIAAGIGSAKGFGFGLLSVAPA